MDQELVQYLDRRFETLDQRFNAIDQRFQAMDQRFETLDHGINQRFQIVDQRFQTLEQGIDRRFDETNERIDEVKRHSGVLVEGLRHELHLVAENLLMHVEVRHREDREYFDRKFDDMQAMTRGSYTHLQQQQEELRQQQGQISQRVENLERKSQA